MPGHDLPTPDDDDADIDPVEKQKIRYNPSSRPARRLETADTDRIRYNPSSTPSQDRDV